MPEGNVNDRDVIRILYEVEKRLDARIDAVLAAIQAIVIVTPPPPEEAIAAILQYTIQGGSNIMPGTPITGVVGNTATPTFTEATATGVVVAPIGPVVFASDTPASVTVDPVTGIATLVAVGTATVSALDQGNGLTDSVVFTVTSVVPPPATVANLNYTLNPTKRR